MVEKPFYIGADRRQRRTDIMRDTGDEFLPSRLILFPLPKRRRELLRHQIERRQRRCKFILPLMGQTDGKISLLHLVGPSLQLLQRHQDPPDDESRQPIGDQTDKNHQRDHDEAIARTKGRLDRRITSVHRLVREHVEMVHMPGDPVTLHKRILPHPRFAVRSIDLSLIQLLLHLLPLEVLYHLLIHIISILQSDLPIPVEHHIRLDRIQNIQYPVILERLLRVPDMMKDQGPDHLAHDLKLETTLRHHMIPALRIQVQSGKRRHEYKERHQKWQNAHRDVR